MEISGKTAIITGGATGIGEVYARAFAAGGANVVISDIRRSEGEKLADELGNGGGSGAIFVEADVTDETQTEKMAEQAVEAFSQIDILVNNAAIYFELGTKKPFDEISSGEWDKVMAVNVRGVWNCARAVAPHMRRRESGKIVNISSVVSHMGAPGFAHYVASKSAVIGLTRALARELGSHNITVNAVAPGLVSNDSSRQLNADEYLERASAGRSIQRGMAPGDLVGAVLFLSSPNSDFISGQTFVVDGGAVMNG